LSTSPGLIILFQYLTASQETSIHIIRICYPGEKSTTYHLAPHHIQGRYKEDTRKIQGRYKEDTRKIQGRYKEDTRKIQGRH
jgi:hypothetical protein